MKLLRSRNSEVITLVLIVVVIVVFFGWLINFTTKECRSNSQCNEGYYCGSDFSCHHIPTIEKTVVSNKLVVPSLILGVAIVVASLILKSKRTLKKDIGQEVSKQLDKLKLP